MDRQPVGDGVGDCCGHGLGLGGRWIVVVVVGVGAGEDQRN
jgi:hypothetical protein